MIPSLVVSEIRSALVEFLSSTFALSDDDVRDALSSFLEDEADGIFRGPYLQVRTPFRSVEPGWTSPLEWLPAGFRPYEHQARSFERLSTLDGRNPSPTLVTTGTGSGKTECFLMPLLDHCGRMRSEGVPGIKALILYPMNALASDQATRIAKSIASEAALAGVTAGLYIGEQGKHTSMGDEHLIDNREAMRADPPDILLTNYKMLDFLLLRNEDRDLWATNTPESLQYVVLDEFHTYDGAQGTDVAMLLRRLGATLGMATDTHPLGTATPVATSATLGSSPEAIVELRSFAEKVFGATFDADSVVGETRQSVEEACGASDYLLPIPDVDAFDGALDLDDVAAIFCSTDDNPFTGGTPLELGQVLLKHPLTRAVLTAAGNGSRSWPDALASIVAFAPSWGRAIATGDRARVERALTEYLRLLSHARREGDRPLFSIEVQLWIREVSRLLRTVQPDPTVFRWRDSAVRFDDHDQPLVAGEELPAVYCRRCGMSGWMALRQENSAAFSVNATSIYKLALERSPLVRVLLRAHVDDPGRLWFSPLDRSIVEGPTDDAVPVLVTPTNDDAEANRCPGCGDRDAIRFLGLQVASLASVSINTLFASEHLESNERKLLAFTDSVQDASHRASFFGGRTHRINLRALMARVIRNVGQLSVADLGDSLLTEAATAADRFGLIPPDLTRDPVIRKAWADEPPSVDGLALLRSRLGFEADLEFGLRSRVGRTLELARVATAHVELDDIEHFAGLIAEEAQRLNGTPVSLDAALTYVRGLLERMRLQGGLHHELLEPFLEHGGRSWFLWGGRPAGLPPFTADQGRPSFFTTATSGDLDSVTLAPRTSPTWVVDWAVRSLGLEPNEGRHLNTFALALLAKETETVRSVGRPGSTSIYALDRRHVIITDVADADEGGTPAPSQVACSMCGHLMAAPADHLDRWLGAPCMRYRCAGHFEPSTPRGAHYYRRLYRSGQTRRVVTGEHTGLLGRRDRENLEEAFKTGTAPDAPNVLTATPTLEMGIDIGDLSAVMLTSVPRNPASYIQRVGRAGRSSGNSLVTTFVRSDTHGLYFLAEPEAMIAGDVRPPNCFLDAIETLQRQYVAFLIDRVATLEIDAPPLPRQINSLTKTALDDGGFLRAIVDASINEPAHVARFLALFGAQLTPSTVAQIRAFAATGIEAAVTDAVETWKNQAGELGKRRDRLSTAIDGHQPENPGSDTPDPVLASLLGQRSAVVKLLQALRNEYSLSALERLGLLPNYNLIDDATTLNATMWSRNGDTYETDLLEYQRPGRLAITEFAPGNSFYAAGHRHYVDALEIGSADEPLYEHWRLCPECGYGAIEIEGDPPTVCPRCASQAIADTGALHTMLRLRTALASGSEESARVFDESDTRTRARYSTAMPIDVEPTSIAPGAWQLDEKAFGAEFADRVHLRSLNLGLIGAPGDTVPIAGEPHRVSPYQVCNHCGAVATVRDDRNGQNEERLHQGWCKVRSGNLKKSWSDLILFHELTTEAVRLVLPISMFEIEERLASFKAALLLGLREDFGGNPDHLEVALSDSPNRGGQGRRRFLVLFDAVPGGTGYLAGIAEPDRMRSLLEAGREVISRCQCTGEGRPACHRCMLGVVRPNEYELARRDIAIEMLDDLLDNWQTTEVATIGDMDLGKVEESELERRFKVALRDWAEGNPNDNISLQPVPGKDGYAAFELRLEHHGVQARYRIDEQEGLSTTPSTVPDFVIRRMDEKAPKIAVYLDGLAYHASSENNNIAADAAKRRGVRADGMLVWNLMWNDVADFHTAAQADPQKEPPLRSLLTGAAKSAAERLQDTVDGLFEIEALNQNPMVLLIDYLSRPDLKEWRRLAMSAVGGAFGAAETGPTPIDAEAVEGVLSAAVAGHPIVPAPAGAPAAFAARFVTKNDLPITVLLDARADKANDELWTVVSSLDDSLSGDRDAHIRRWRDWLQWNNVLQFIDSPGRDAMLAATSEDPDGVIADSWLLGLADGDDAPDEAAGPVAREELTEEMLDEIDQVIDTDVERFVRAALFAGAPLFEAGAEIDGFPVEAGWRDQKIGVLANDEEWTAPGWDARRVDDWTLAELLAAIEERS